MFNFWKNNKNILYLKKIKKILVNLIFSKFFNLTQFNYSLIVKNNLATPTHTNA